MIKNHLKTQAATSVIRRPGQLSWDDIVSANIGSVVHTEPVGSEDGFQGTMSEWQLGQLQFVFAKVRGASVRGIHSDDPDLRKRGLMWLSFCLAGKVEYDFPDGGGVIARQQFASINNTQPYALTFSPNTDVMWVRLPTAYLEPLIGEQRMSVFQGNKGIGHVAFQALTCILSQAGHIDTQYCDSVVNGALNFIVAAIRDQTPNGPHLGSLHRGSALRRLKGYLANNITDDNLSPQSVADALGMSTRYINKLFEDDGTSLMRWILQQRLAMAAAQLVRDTPLRQSISDIAFACGFKNLSHFSRAFHERYGCSASQFRKRRFEADLHRRLTWSSPRPI